MTRLRCGVPIQYPSICQKRRRRSIWPQASSIVFAARHKHLQAAILLGWNWSSNMYPNPSLGASFTGYMVSSRYICFALCRFHAGRHLWDNGRSTQRLRYRLPVPEGCYIVAILRLRAHGRRNRRLTATPNLRKDKSWSRCHRSICTVRMYLSSIERSLVSPTGRGDGTSVRYYP